MKQMTFSWQGVLVLLLAAIALVTLPIMGPRRA